MRWMKHLTLAHDDDALAALLEEMGPEGYGIYWLLLEHVGAGIEKDSDAIPSRCHSILKWSQLCHCSTRIFRKFADRTAELKLIECKSQAELKQFSSRLPVERIQIDIPKLLKYRDEYSKKSGQTPAIVGARLDRDTHKIENTDTPDTKSAVAPLEVAPISAPKSDPIADWYNTEFYPIFPLHKAGKAGLKAARAELKTGELRIAALTALRAQLPELLTRDPSKRPYPASWINGHRWEDEPSPELISTDPYARFKDDV